MSSSYIGNPEVSIPLLARQYARALGYADERIGKHVIVPGVRAVAGGWLSVRGARADLRDGDLERLSRLRALSDDPAGVFGRE